MRRLAEPEQLDRIADRRDHPIDALVERLRRIERELDRFSLDPSV